MKVKSKPCAIALGLMTFAAGPVAALDLAQCRFSQECLEGEACMDTTFDVTVGYGGPETDIGAPVRLITPAETVSAFRYAQAVPYLVVAGTDSQSVLLSIEDNGTARYTVHLNAAGMSVTYLGMCEVK